MEKIIYLDNFNMQEIKNAGFDGFFVKYESKQKCEELKAQADKLGLIFSSIHAPITKCNYAFFDNSAPFENLICEILDIASALNIPFVITHPNFRPTPPLDIEKGIPVYGRLFAYAKEKGVTLCVENLEYENYTRAILDAHFGKEYCGFCWDTGHNLCYTPSAFYPYPPTYLHLNDNYGSSTPDIPVTDDLHLLPFDGKVDWQSVIATLKSHNYNGHLTFELKKNQSPLYSSLTNAEYLKKAHDIAVKIENQLNI